MSKQHKQYSDVIRVIEGKRSAKAIDATIYDYLAGLQLAPIYDAEAEHYALVRQPDVDDIPAVLSETEVDDDGNAVVIFEAHSPNFERDSKLLALSLKYEHLIVTDEYIELVNQEDIDSAPIVYSEDGTSVVTEAINYNQLRDLRIAELEQPRPDIVVDVDGFKQTAVVGLLRKNEYPDIGDTLDAIIKQLAADREVGKVLNPDMELIVNKCLEVKSKHKKK